MNGFSKEGQLPMYQFGISTHLFHEHRLSRDHLVHIAAHGFEAVELFATRSHFDYTSTQAIAELAEWLSDTQPGAAFDSRADRRAHAQAAVGSDRFRMRRQTRAAGSGRRRDRRPRIALAARFRFGTSSCTSASRRANSSTHRDNHADAARRSVEEIATGGDARERSRGG